jgi:hypothetical protein
MLIEEQEREQLCSSRHDNIPRQNCMEIMKERMTPRVCVCVHVCRHAKEFQQFRPLIPTLSGKLFSYGITVSCLSASSPMAFLLCDRLSGFFLLFISLSMLVMSTADINLYTNNSSSGSSNNNNRLREAARIFPRVKPKL